MIKKLMASLVLSTLLMVFGMPLWAAETAAEEAAPEMTAPRPAAETVEINAGACANAASSPGEVKNDLFNPDGTLVCEFCNLTGFANCDTLHGTACSVAGVSQPCYFNPPCSCEWSRCRCNGTSWRCFGMV